MIVGVVFVSKTGVYNSNNVFRPRATILVVVVELGVAILFNPTNVITFRRFAKVQIENVVAFPSVFVLEAVTMPMVSIFVLPSMLAIVN